MKEEGVGWTSLREIQFSDRSTMMLVLLRHDGACLRRAMTDRLERGPGSCPVPPSASCVASAASAADERRPTIFLTA
jgi:hypothetical protein